MLTQPFLRLLLVFVILIGLSVSVPVPVGVQGVVQEEEFIDGVILDAGSSGTRAHVFKWPKRTGYKIPQVTELTLNKTASQTRPGISSYYPDTTGLKSNLAPILNYALSVIPEATRWESATFLKATAGMRLLNDTAQTIVLDEVRRVIKSYPWSFLPSYAKVISGEEEGVFGWVSANYLSNNSFVLDPNFDTYGVIDMGGASMQITFVPANPPAFHAYNITVGVVRQVYTWSFLYFGQDQARSRHFELLAKDQAATTLRDPCLLKGYSTSLKLSNLTYQITGTGNFTECKARTFLLLNRSTPCESGSGCGINGIYTPPLRGKFYAISSFTYAWTFFKLRSSSSIQELVTATQAFCGLDWNEAVRQNPGVEAGFLSGYCFTGYYIANVLVDGFGFELDSRNLEVTAKINEVSLDWTLGSMLYEVGILPWKPNCNAIPTKSDCDLYSFGCRWIGYSCVPNGATSLSLIFPLLVLSLFSLLLFI